MEAGGSRGNGICYVFQYECWLHLTEEGESEVRENPVSRTRLLLADHNTACLDEGTHFVTHFEVKLSYGIDGDG